MDKDKQVDEQLWRECLAVIPPHKPSNLPWFCGTVDGDISVYIVDGDKEKLQHDPDYVEGGNDQRYPEFIPDKTVLLDDNIELHDLPFICYHECHERRLMATGMDYDTAHEKANAAEMELRQRLMDMTPKTGLFEGKEAQGSSNAQQQMYHELSDVTLVSKFLEQCPNCGSKDLRSNADGQWCNAPPCDWHTKTMSAYNETAGGALVGLPLSKLKVGRSSLVFDPEGIKDLRKRWSLAVSTKDVDNATLIQLSGKHDKKLPSKKPEKGDRGEGKNPHAVALGKMGGDARKRSIAAPKRSKIASMGGRARWSGHEGKKDLMLSGKHRTMPVAPFLSA